METGMAMWGGQPRERRWVSVVGWWGWWRVGSRGVVVEVVVGYWGSADVEGGEGREVEDCCGGGGCCSCCGCCWYLWSSMSCIRAASSVIVSSNLMWGNFCCSTRWIDMLSARTRCTCE